MTSPLQAMKELLEEDARYKFEAYQFIREALQYAHEHMELPEMATAEEIEVPFGQPQPRHVTGQQLCHACRKYALDQYGYLSRMVLSRWGIESTSDFGELVYNLIRIEQMRKSESDRREDFDDVYDFEEAFEPKFEFTPRSDD
ncbi:MAG: Minf_1886 family protein [Pirellulaceae bacterium]